jgi:hypothetical protein
MAGARRAASVCGLRPPNLCDLRDDLSGYADPIAGLVSRHVVDNDSEKRRQRVGVAASVGAEEL